MKKHHSLPRNRRQLALSRETLGEAFKVFIVAHDHRDVAAGAYHVWGDTIELLYNGSSDEALDMRPNHALYWHVMQWARERGLRHVDLGGAYADTPLAGFKQQWGATPRARLPSHPPYRAARRLARSRSRRSGTAPSTRRVA